MDILLAKSDKDIQECFPVIRELRSHLDEKSFIQRIRSQENSGYLLAYVKNSGCIVAVAGFRLGENLAWGRFLYIDDLVTLERERSRGYGAVLLSWLANWAIKEGCVEIHLDSGVQRKDARRFYEREKMTMAGFHFRKVIKN